MSDGTARTPEEIWAGPPQPKVSVSVNFFLLIGVCILLGVGLVFAPPALAGVLTFAFIAFGWVLSVVLHEFGHAFVAWRAGDTSVIAKGYLSLDPLKYADLGTTILIPLLALAFGGIGFPGAAVYLRPDLMRSRLGRSLSSLAGPVMTGVTLLLIGVCLPAASNAPALFKALAFLGFLQATAMVLNLLPVPGLDGYGVIRPFLPRAVQIRLRPFEAIAILILFAALFFVPGLIGIIFSPALILTDLLGIPGRAIAGGWDAFAFWKAAGI